ncbi:MAG: hypothetical protein AAF501_17475 [Pseudomonadota bacterium]
MKTLLLALVAVSITGTAMAGELASGAQIKSSISGKTVQGSMEASGAYTEYYAADGSIRGNGYTGKWHVTDRAMCFTYGEDPADCWGVRIDGANVAWMKDGVAGGTGTIVDGNPNGF